MTIQAQILELLKSLVEQEKMALILITHDLGVVAGVCQRTNVMYAGSFVETGFTDDLFAHPKHPYTVGLLRSVPRLDAAHRRRLEPIHGAPRNMSSVPTGCAFAPRCEYATQESWDTVPELHEVQPGHSVACWNPVPDSDVRAAGVGAGADE